MVKAGISVRQSCAAEPARVKRMAAKVVLTLQQQGVGTAKGLPCAGLPQGQRTGIN